MASASYMDWWNKVKEWAKGRLDSEQQDLSNMFGKDPDQFAAAYANALITGTNAYKYLAPHAIRYIKQSMRKIFAQEALQSMGMYGTVPSDVAGADDRANYLANFFDPKAGFISHEVGQQLYDAVIDKIGQYYSQYRTAADDYDLIKKKKDSGETLTAEEQALYDKGPNKEVVGENIWDMMALLDPEVNGYGTLYELAAVANGALGGIYNRNIQESTKQKFEDYGLMSSYDAPPLEDFLRKWFSSKPYEGSIVSEEERQRRSQAKQAAKTASSSTTTVK